MIEHFFRFQDLSSGGQHWGVLDGEQIIGLTQAPWKELRRTTAIYSQKDVGLLPPAEPTKIIAFGYNYKDLFSDKSAKSREEEPHFSQVGFEPVIFLKSTNCLSAHGGEVRIPAFVKEVWVEVEVAVVMGKRAKNLVNREEARSAMFGLTIANDVTALNVFGRDWHLARSKALDGFCPLGPSLVKGVDDADLKMTTSINGQISQSSRSGQRILDSLESIVFASKIMTLEPGDLILTGTPRGARQSVVMPGDRVCLEIQELGRLESTFVSEVEGV